MIGVATLFVVLATVDGAAAPEAPDGGAPAAAEPTRRPSDRPAPADRAIRGVTTSERVVALTFDACATMRQPNGFDRKVFDIVTTERIPATFYLSGRWVEKHPSAAKLIARAPLIELGNHSYSHPRLTLVRKDRMRMQILRTNEILEQKLGRKALSLRPPAGAWEADLVRTAGAAGLPVVTWTVVSGDVGGHVAPRRMVESVLEQVRPGAIVIFHINRREPHTKLALPGIVAGLRERGYRFVTVSELLALPDAVPELAKPSHWGFGTRKRPRLPDRPAPTESPAGAAHATLSGEGQHANPQP